MTRLGWGILIAVLLVVAGFVATTSFDRRAGVAAPAAAAVAAPPPPTAAGLLAVPVAGVARGAITDSWGDARGGGTRGHRGIDIAAPAGATVVAAAPGIVEKLFRSDRGGTTVYVRSPDRRWTYYYAHLAGYADGLREGRRVAARDPLGFVGDTGDAGAGNYHLHFATTRTRPEQRWWQGEDVNPYPMLVGSAAAR